MDVRFENRYVETDRMTLEYYSKVGCRRAILFRVALMCVTLLMLVFSLKFGDMYTAIFMAAASVFFLGCAIAAPFRSLRWIKKNDQSVFDGKKYEEVIRFSDNITITKGTGSMALEYAQIIEMIRLKHSIALKHGKNISILLAPDGFTVGKPDDFETFLRAMCPNLKRRRS